MWDSNVNVVIVWMVFKNAHWYIASNVIHKISFLLHLNFTMKNCRSPLLYIERSFPLFLSSHVYFTYMGTIVLLVKGKILCDSLSMYIYFLSSITYSWNIFHKEILLTFDLISQSQDGYHHCNESQDVWTLW
jgi:hypothetical protein